MNTRFD